MSILDPIHRKRLPIALPTAHVMGFAPLDVWARLLIQARFRIQPRYLLRFGAAMVTATLGTTSTLPERLLLAPYLWLRFGRDPCVRHDPGVIVILGYFRSGTTHLQYLLSCDRRNYTTRWRHALAPQGFWLSWTVLRWTLIPFLPNRRPQDDVPFGPEWPAEDDFALTNWALASSLPGRLVVPDEHAHYQRFHALDGLSETERRRWSRTQAAFIWKLTTVARKRRLLLKTPSHTARVPELMRMLGRERVRFIHISRPAGEVVRSNLNLFHRMEELNLQDPQPDDQIRAHIIEEFNATERRFLEDSDAIPEGHLARLRYEDVVTDPIGQIRLAYEQLGLTWDDAFETAMMRYLDAVRDHVATSTREPVEIDDPDLIELDRLMGHNEPPGDAGGPFPVPVRRGVRWGIAGTICGAVIAAALWLTIAKITHNRYLSLVWPSGAIIGLLGVRAAGAGGWRLGLWASILTFIVAASVLVPATYFEHGYTGIHMRKSLIDAYNDYSPYIYLGLGMLTAYRFASRKLVRPPGLGL